MNMYKIIILIILVLVTACNKERKIETINSKKIHEIYKKLTEYQFICRNQMFKHRSYSDSIFKSLCIFEKELKKIELMVKPKWNWYDKNKIINSYENTTDNYINKLIEFSDKDYKAKLISLTESLYFDLKKQKSKYESKLYLELLLLNTRIILHNLIDYEKDRHIFFHIKNNCPSLSIFGYKKYDSKSDNYTYRAHLHYGVNLKDITYSFNVTNDKNYHVKLYDTINSGWIFNIEYNKKPIDSISINLNARLLYPDSSRKVIDKIIKAK